MIKHLTSLKLFGHLEECGCVRQVCACVPETCPFSILLSKVKFKRKKKKKEKSHPSLNQSPEPLWKVAAVS